MIWNIEDCKTPSKFPRTALTLLDNGPHTWATTTKWEQKLKDIINSLEDGHPRFRHLVWKQLFNKPPERSAQQFSLPLEEEYIKWTVWLTDEALWARYSSLSMITILEGEERQWVQDEVYSTLKASDTERNEKDEVAVHGVTYLAWISRK